MPGFFNPKTFEKSNAGRPMKIPQCGKCGLSRKAACNTPKMDPSGRGRRRILFIGPSPGKDDDVTGKAFMGESGKLLRKILKRLGYDLNDCWSTHAVICRADEVEPYMVSCCRPNLRKTIRDLKPNVIIPLGMEALESLLMGLWKKNIGSITRWVGWTIPVEAYDAWVCPTYDPSFLLKRDNDPILALTFKNQLKEALSLEQKKPNYLHLPDLEKQVEVVKSPSRARKLMKALNAQSGYLAFDYETTGLKPEKKKQKIVSVSFHFVGGGAEKTFAFMMHPSLEEMLKKVLLNRKLRKIASNMKFEERWTRAKLGYGVLRWYWDTMLNAHLMDNRPKITSVKFQAFVLLGIPDYDSHISEYLKSKNSNGINRIHELDEEELLLYNGLDSLLEYLVMVRQKEIIGGE
jgi:uracil-DNA glycosylase family 4